jgi:hypothetical protein
VPIREIVCPLKYRRKFRWRSALQACEMPGLLTDGEVDAEVSLFTASILSSATQNRLES